ncbi:class I SAM-dependent methyltransferase [Pendulispora albinea]|uniref:Class I SAM-dependent methyltransferase n=1 Tax=Pendulispora albinea TaxID=2741071 RepID=A0ABZ2MC15_9BACT
MQPGTNPTNPKPLDDWNGARGARWATHHEWLDRSFAAFGAAALNAACLHPGEHVLDVGCGAGATTLELVRHVQPHGRVLGVDISEALLQRARERARAQPTTQATLDFELADASRHAFAPGSFDVLFSRFGVMFFADPPRAFTHLHAALARGGRATFVCWRSPAENPWFHLPLRALQGVLPPGPPADPLAPGPFAFADRHRIESILRQSGFSDIAITPFDAPLYVAADADESFDQTLRIGPFATMLEGHPEDVRQRGRAAIRAALAEHADAHGVSLAGATWIVRARA